MERLEQATRFYYDSNGDAGFWGDEPDGAVGVCGDVFEARRRGVECAWRRECVGDDDAAGDVLLYREWIDGEEAAGVERAVLAGIPGGDGLPGIELHF